MKKSKKNNDQLKLVKAVNKNVRSSTRKLSPILKSIVGKKADEAIEMSKKEISSTFSKHVLSSIGGFGSMYSLKDIFNNYRYLV